MKVKMEERVDKFSYLLGLIRKMKCREERKRG